MKNKVTLPPSVCEIRRHVYELTLDDLSTSPVWEFALDEEGAPGQDEATVRPYSFSGALDPSEGMLIVAARFWLADGTQLSGYLTPPPTDDRSLGVIQPQIVTYSGHVSFWCGVCPADSTRIPDAWSRREVRVSHSLRVSRSARRRRGLWHSSRVLVFGELL